jgi:hypothetical protein
VLCWGTVPVVHSDDLVDREAPVGRSLIYLSVVGAWVQFLPTESVTIRAPKPHVIRD